MTVEANVEALRRAYAAWSDSKGGSTDVWLDLIADDIEWRSLASGQPGAEFTRAHATKADVAGYFAGLLAGWDMVHYTIDEYIGQNDRIVALGHCSWRNRATGKVVGTPKADFWRFRDGKAVGFFEFYDTNGLINGSVPDAA